MVWGEPAINFTTVLTLETAVLNLSQILHFGSGPFYTAFNNDIPKKGKSKLWKTP